MFCCAVGLQAQTFIKLCNVICCSTVIGAAAFMQSGQNEKNRFMFLVYKMLECVTALPNTQALGELQTIQVCTGSVVSVCFLESMNHTCIKYPIISCSIVALKPMEVQRRLHKAYIYTHVDRKHSSSDIPHIFCSLKSDGHVDKGGTRLSPSTHCMMTTFISF